MGYCHISDIFFVFLHDFCLNGFLLRGGFGSKFLTFSKQRQCEICSSSIKHIFSLSCHNLLTTLFVCFLLLSSVFEQYYTSLLFCRMLQNEVLVLLRKRTTELTSASRLFLWHVLIARRLVSKMCVSTDYCSLKRPRISLINIRQTLSKCVYEI